MNLDMLLSERNIVMKLAEKYARTFSCQEKRAGTNGLATATSHGSRSHSLRDNNSRLVELHSSLPTIVIIVTPDKSFATSGKALTGSKLETTVLNGKDVGGTQSSMISNSPAPQQRWNLFSKTQAMDASNLVKSNFTKDKRQRALGTVLSQLSLIAKLWCN